MTSESRIFGTWPPHGPISARAVATAALAIAGVATVFTLSADWVWRVSLRQAEAKLLPNFAQPARELVPRGLPSIRHDGDRVGYLERSHVAKRLPAPEREALAVLANARVFSGSRVGFSGEWTATATAFNELYASSSARQAFSGLAEEAPLVGRLYGLCGLLETGSPRAERVRARLVSSTRVVPTLFGCGAGEQAVATLATKLELLCPSIH
jgi:hypothetical protein